MTFKTRALRAIEDTAHELTQRVSEAAPNLPSPRDLASDLRTPWNDQQRVIAGVTGGLMTLFGMRRGFVAGCVVGSLGLGLIAMALVNPGRPLDSLSDP